MGIAIIILKKNTFLDIYLNVKINFLVIFNQNIIKDNYC